MLTKYVLPGEKVELKIISNSLSDQNNTDKKTYVSQIYEIISDDRFQILIPIEKAKLILLRAHHGESGHVQSIQTMP